MRLKPTRATGDPMKVVPEKIKKSKYMRLDWKRPAMESE
jgi:hypothetical protein